MNTTVTGMPLYPGDAGGEAANSTKPVTWWSRVALGPTSRPLRVIGIVGACGGAGTSIVAACVANGLRRKGARATLVDLDTHSTGIDLLLGVDTVHGARWSDLVEARGEVEGLGVVAALPRWNAVPVLSGTTSGAPPDDDVVLDVCRGLVMAGETLILDLPRPGAWGSVTQPNSQAESESTGDGLAIRTLLAGCEKVLLVVPLTVVAAVGAQRVREVLRGAGVSDVRVVARGPAPGSVHPDDVSDALGLPLAATVGRDAGLTHAIEVGVGPNMAHRTVLGRFATTVAAAL